VTAHTGAKESGTDFVAKLRRWEDAGGLWRVLSHDRDAITVGLYRCDDGEEADRSEAFEGSSELGWSQGDSNP
jgi:hypothetical protein